MSSPPDFVPPVDPDPKHYVTQILPSDSPALSKYLSKFTKGATLSDSGWTVEEVLTSTDLPPDPDIGPVTKVTLVLTPPLPPA